VQKCLITTANVFIPAAIRYTNISGTYLPADASRPRDVSTTIKNVQIISYFWKNRLPYYSLMMPTIFNKGFDISEINIKYAARGFCLTEATDASILQQSNYTPEELSKVRLFIASHVPDKIKDYKLTEGRYKHFLKRYRFYQEKARNNFSSDVSRCT
jgi:hypothetical protein